MKTHCYTFLHTTPVDQTEEEKENIERTKNTFLFLNKLHLMAVGRHDVFQHILS